MKVTIIPVGNSRGVRLPKAVLEQVGFGDAAELTFENGRIVLAPFPWPRSEWAQAFAVDPAVETTDDRDWLDAALANDAE